METHVNEQHTDEEDLTTDEYHQDETKNTTMSEKEYTFFAKDIQKKTIFQGS